MKKKPSCIPPSKPKVQAPHLPRDQLLFVPHTVTDDPFYLPIFRLAPVIFLLLAMSTNASAHSSTVGYQQKKPHPTSAIFLSENYEWRRKERERKKENTTRSFKGDISFVFSIFSVPNLFPQSVINKPGSTALTLIFGP